MKEFAMTSIPNSGGTATDNELFGIIYGVTDNPNWAVSEVHDAILAAGYRKLEAAAPHLMAQALEEAADDYRHYATPNARLYLRARAADLREHRSAGAGE